MNRSDWTAGDENVARLLGRAYVYGLGAGGEAGVTRAIEILRNELDVSMALTGTTSVRAVSRSVVADGASM